MPEGITFRDENSSSTFEPQLLQCLPFILEVNQQEKTFPLSTTLNKVPLLTQVNQNNLSNKIQILLCRKMQSNAGFTFYSQVQRGLLCCRIACVPAKNMTFMDHSWTTSCKWLFQVGLGKHFQLNIQDRK